MVLGWKCEGVRVRVWRCGTLCFGHGIVVAAAITHQIRIANSRVARWQLTTHLGPCGGHKAHTKPIAAHEISFPWRRLSLWPLA